MIFLFKKLFKYFAIVIILESVLFVAFNWQVLFKEISKVTAAEYLKKGQNQDHNLESNNDQLKLFGITAMIFNDFVWQKKSKESLNKVELKATKEENLNAKSTTSKISKLYNEVNKTAMTRLQPGSTIDIIAPSFSVTKETMVKIKDYLTSLGHKSRVMLGQDGMDIFYKDDNYTRAKFFRDSFLSEESDALWVVNGGGGAAEIIPYLAGKVDGFDGLPQQAPKKKKLIIGFSDFTAIHLFVGKLYGWQTLHGPCLNQMAKCAPKIPIDKQSFNLLENAICQGCSDSVDYNLKKISNTQKLCNHTIKGEIVGGNLTLVENSLGTDWEIETEDKIVFLEEVSEDAWQIERSLTHLLEAGKFNNVKAIIFGEFTKVQNIRYIPDVQNRFADKFYTYKYLDRKTPIFTLNCVGHGMKNFPLPLFSDVNINCENENYKMTVKF